jgi:GntR family transcriptional regulator, transcriptional repressor for pyruvate dehydrogenase complex
MAGDHSMKPRPESESSSEPFRFGQVEREPKLADKVADLMLERILSGELGVGDRLPSERELGDQFGVSRTVVREAVRALLAKGVLDVRAGSGLRVAAVGPATVSESMNLYVRGGTLDFRRVHEVRRMLEVHIAGLAAERASDEDVERLAAVHEKMEAEIEDVEAAALFDLEFHRAIARATHNELFLVVMDSIGHALLDIRRANIGRGGTGPLTIEEHGEILAAVRARKPERARKAMRRHLDNVERVSNRLTAEAGEQGTVGTP